MPFNSTDFTVAPWNSGIMTLTHEEVVEVMGHCQTIIDDFKVSNQYEEPASEYVVPKYNEIDWKKSINGDTYAVLFDRYVGTPIYDPNTNTQGINESGIVSEPVEEQPPTEEEQPTEEA
jgi:hypothetical protein